MKNIVFAELRSERVFAIIETQIGKETNAMEAWENLNQAQAQAVSETEGFIRVAAGAGS